MHSDDLSQSEGSKRKKALWPGLRSRTLWFLQYSIDIMVRSYVVTGEHTGVWIPGMRFTGGHPGAWNPHVYHGDANVLLCVSRFYSTCTKAGIAAHVSNDSSLHWPICTCLIIASVTSSKWERRRVSYYLDLRQQENWLLSLQQSWLTLENRGHGKEVHFKYHTNNRSVYGRKYTLLWFFDAALSIISLC